MSDADLARVLSCLEDGRDEDAHAALAAAWRERRSPRLAELAALLDARSPSTLRARLDALAAPRVGAMLERFHDLSDVDDPRLSTRVLALLESPPFTGPSSRPLLEALVDAAARLADPRLVERAPAIARIWTLRVTPKPSQVALVKRLKQAASSVAKRPPRAPTSEDVALEASLFEKLRPTARRERTAAELLADVYANPADDGPRLVLADYLLERGDPRGELIALQFKRRDGGLDAAGAARETALLKKHGKEWLGPLAPVISWGKGYAQSRFERGFLAIADVIFSVGKKMALVLEEPSWAVVEELRGSWPWELLEHAPLRGLRRLERSIGTDTFQALKQKGVTFPCLEELRVVIENADSFDGFAFARIFPAARVVTTFAAVPLHASELAELLQRLPPLQRLVLDRAWAGHEALRSDQEAFATLLAEVGSLSASIPELALQEPWNAAPKRAPLELRIVDGRWVSRADDVG